MDWAGLRTRGSRKPTAQDFAIRHPSGSPEIAKTILDGSFSRYGQTHTSDPAKAWTAPLPSERFARWIHGFGWLHDLAALGSDEAKRLSRELVISWLGEFGSYHSFVWHPQVLADRVLALAVSYPFSGKGGSDADSPDARVSASLDRQSAILARTYDRLPRSAPRLRSLIALQASSLRLRQNPRQGGRLQTALADTLKADILPDGGHASRSIDTTLSVYADLLAFDALLEASGKPALPAVTRALDRMAPFLATLSHADGTLATFQGGGEGNARALAKAMSQPQARPFGFAPNVGYQRIEAGGTVLLMDAGLPPPFPLDRHAHLSPLAFELSSPSGCLITSCGFGPEQPLSWREAVRQPSAHSTLDIEGASLAKVRPAAELYDGLMIGDGEGGHIVRDPGPLRIQRREAELGTLLEGTHHGFVPSTGLVHTRRLYLSSDGRDLRGEDSLGPAGDGPVGYESGHVVQIRFHIHPDVVADLAPGGTHIVLKSGGEDWAFLASAPGAKFDIRESAYLGTGSRPRPCQQIVLHFTLTEPRWQGRWGFRRKG